jgi:hypothetical protein
MHLKELNMKFLIVRASLAALLLTGTALADSTAYTPVTTGVTLPNADQANSASSAQNANYATTAGSTGYATSAGTATTATNANYATSAGSAKTATSAGSADSAAYATSAGTASQAAGLTAGNNCPAGTALSVTKGVLGCVSSVTSITGNLSGSQIVGNITNATGINISGNIVSSNGYVYGVTGLFTDNAVFSNTYAGRWGGSNATFNGNATSSTTAGTATYAASSIVGILHQSGGGGDLSTYYCDSGYHTVFLDTNVDSTNNAFFAQCVQNGH